MPFAFTCPRCGKTSHNPKDAEFGYCGACHDFTRRKLEIVACIAEGCKAKPPERHVMCPDHWAKLSRSKQQEIYRARYKFEQGFEAGDTLLKTVLAEASREAGE